MARALGARVGESPAPEVGFQEMRVLPVAASRTWFGPIEWARVFQWHYEAFDLPRGATALATSEACPLQAFAIGPHLAMQFHIELDAEKAGRWADEESDRYRQALARHPASVHDAQRLRADIPALLPGHQALADRIYGRWLEAVSAR
jgi:GMP synthase-like glutamine amidotransferase